MVYAATGWEPVSFMEDYVPRAPWQRRRVIDSPRPGGRRWAGLRRSGSLARQVLVRSVGRRQGETTLVRPDAPRGRFPLRRPQLTTKIDPAASDVVEPDTADTIEIPAPAGGTPVAAAMAIPLLPGERTTGRRIRFALVNGCTIMSLLLGVSAIFIAMQGDDVRLAALCLIACVVFDGLDGALARKLGVASPFGAQMDSLADMCSFGVAAPVVVYAGLSGSASPAIVVPACALVAICAAIRLARFNVSPKDGRFFCGVPTTLVAAVLALAMVISPDVPAAAQVGAVVLLALAMVSSFPYVKIGRVLRLPAWLLVVPVVGVFIDYQTTFVLVVVAYLASGPLLWLRERRVA
jgi:CDP-diacylglycerol---serine O-phosphatidyltransferase